MATFYVRGDTGSDLLSGFTAALAKRTVAAALLLASAGDTIVLAETINEPAATALAGVRFTQEVGGTAFDWKGSTDPGAANWTLHSGTTYKVTVPAGMTLGAVCDRWKTRVDSSGRHYGYLALLADPGGGALSGTGYYYGGTTLYVRLSDGVSPATLAADPVEYINANFGRGLDLTGTGGCEVDGLGRGRFRQFIGTAANYPLCASGNNNQFRNLNVYDADTHNAIFYSANNANNTMVGVRSFCCSRQDGQLFTSYASASAGDITGGRYTGCKAHAYSLLDSAGAAMSALRIGCFYSHTESLGGGTVDDIEYDLCAAIFYPGQDSSNGFNSGDVGAKPSDPYAWSAHPLRVKRSRVMGAYGCGISGSVAYKQCFWEAPNTVTADDVQIAGGNFRVLFESCTFKTIMNPVGAGGQALFSVGAGVELTLVGNTWNQNRAAVGDNGWYCDLARVASSAVFVAGSAGFLFNFFGNVFQWTGNNGPLTANRLVNGDSTFRVGNYNIANNWYNGNADVFCANASGDTEAHFRANIDTVSTKFGTDPGFADVTDADWRTAGTPSRASALLTTAAIAPAHSAAYGGNGRPFSGMYGAYQRGGNAGLSTFVHRQIAA